MCSPWPWTLHLFPASSPLTFSSLSHLRFTIWISWGDTTSLVPLRWKKCHYFKSIEKTRHAEWIILVHLRVEPVWLDIKGGVAGFWSITQWLIAALIIFRLWCLHRETWIEKPVCRINISALVSARYISLAQAPLTFIYSALTFTVANSEAEEKIRPMRLKAPVKGVSVGYTVYPPHVEQRAKTAG